MVVTNDPREPTCYVLIVPTFGAEAYGPFETENDATLWAMKYLPSRVMFSTLPVYATLRV